MARQITQTNAFLASPSDVVVERKVATEVIAELNRTIAPDLGLLIRLIRWEDMIPAIEKRAEQVILDQAEIDKTDIFIGILWNRFGTHTGQADSGTEEEFKMAYQAWQQQGKPRIMLYFCQRPANLVQKDELEQKLAVLNFKDVISKRGIFREYSTPQEFEVILRQDVTKHLLTAKELLDQAAMRTRSDDRLHEAHFGRRPESPPNLQKPPDRMIRIPAGNFLAGRATTKVTLDHDFFIDEVPVTNHDFFQFMEITGFMLCHPGPVVSKAVAHIVQGVKERPDHPVTMVTWYDAQAYAAWAGKRLPNALEWERAARGRRGRLYPWGNKFDHLRCNSKESGIGHTTPVRQYDNGRSEDSCFDMAGNVFEWVSDWADSPRFSSAPNSEKINRGASYNRDAHDLVCWYTESDPPDLRMTDVGFRCVWTPSGKNNAQKAYLQGR